MVRVTGTASACQAKPSLRSHRPFVICPLELIGVVGPFFPRFRSLFPLDPPFGLFWLPLIREFRLLPPVDYFIMPRTKRGPAATQEDPPPNRKPPKPLNMNTKNPEP